MDPVTLVLIPGILGGFALAWLIAKIGARIGARSGAKNGARIGSRGPSTLVYVPLEPVSTDVINIAHIRAAGLGGLGLFAMALAVAWFVPAIRLAVSAGVVLGALLGAVMIFRRSRIGPLPSSGGSAGANVVLSIDRPASSDKEDADTPSNRLRVAHPKIA